ncbi:probable beta-1,4-xylosyltransferase IRX9L [Phragmites australis]|uniref:probable beta-1,4-xylosyltransferase IRX9L n=1 Tax=Phragmites australis TaxID=29695 RepID=UPI002D7958C8|nr:probable beta-1,4-xylosyltransferase IRX9L [Phragmites australis]
MARRNAGAMQREGSVKDWSEFDTLPSPKLAYSQSYVAMRGLLTSVASLDPLLVSSSLKSAWAAISSHRHSRSLERPKAKWMNWKRAMFRLLVCFLVGIFIGFTPLFSLDLSKKIASENERLPFDGDVVDRQMLELRSTKLEPFAAEAEATEELQVDESPPVPAMLDDEADFIEASHVDPPVNDSVIVVRKQLIIVTSTSVRPHQAYYLNRLAHVLKNVPPPLLWIVAEWPYQSRETAEILRSSGVMYRHLICNRNTTNIRKIIVCQKNNAIFHTKKHRLDGIVHFADEERAYSVDLFEEMRKIRRFGTWPVAIHVGAKYRVVLEGPLCRGNQVTGWHANQRRGVPRRFPIGFSGFAFNSTILWDPQRWNSPTLESIILHSGGRGGLQESRFIEKLVEDESQMEGLADNCTRIMVWNFDLEPPQLNYPTGWLLQKNLDAVVPIT